MIGATATLLAALVPIGASAAQLADPYAIFHFGAANYSVGEAEGSASITITRTGDTSHTDTLHFNTLSGGSATPGDDYTEVSTLITFLPGSTEETVTVPIIDDARHEGNETVRLGILESSPGTDFTWDTRSATLTIVDNDPVVAAASGKIAAASLSKKSFKSSQTKSVALNVRFSLKSKKFDYLLQIKRNGKWAKLRTVRKTGSFSGTRKLTLKSVFAGKAAERGQYRLTLSADKNSRTLTFKVN
jgi:hypothetical protein